LANHYADAIKIITDKDADYRALLIEIAKAHPKSVVDANDRITGGWQFTVKKMLKEGGREALIPAIRLCREYTNMGLKEAKEAVEGMM
jgi:ribosomal protein L7/L12